MAARTPEDRALSDVEKAMKDYEKAVDKRVAADQKADEARAAEHRALRTLEWTARHPDLADDFDLAAFSQSLKAPFDEPGDETGGEPDAIEKEAEAIGDAVESGAIDPDALEEPEKKDAIDDGEPAQGGPIEALPEIDAADGDDDPWGDEA